MAVKKKTTPKPNIVDDSTLSTLFGRVKTSQVEVEVDKKFTVFDFVNDINFNKQYLYTDDTAFDYDPYTINRAMTIFPDTFVTGEFLNMNYHLDKRMQHDYLFYGVQSRKRWKQGGWIKRTEVEKKELKILKDVAKVIQYNIKRTKQFWSLLTDEQKKQFLEKYIYPDSRNVKK
jgi:hypothetical protein